MELHRKVKNSIIFIGVILSLITSGITFSAQDPVVMLKDVTGSVMSELKNNRADISRHPSKLYSLVNHLILPHVDFAEMSRWVVGRNAWNKADSATQHAFVEEFKTMVVRAYARSLLEYTGEHIEFLPLRATAENKERIQISSYIMGNFGSHSKVRMDYRLIREGDEWKVYDIIIEGVSIVQGYRAQFADDIRDGGLQGAINRMHRHNK